MPNDNYTVSSVSITYQGITERLLNCFNDAMDIHETRRINLRQLIDEKFSGVAARLATALDMKPPQLHRWLAKEEAKRQNINEHSARGIELRLSLPRGWLDQEGGGEDVTLSPALPPRQLTVSELLDSLKSEVGELPEPIRRAASDMMIEYIKTLDEETGKQLAAAIERIIGKK